MIAVRMVKLIEAHSDELADGLLRKVQSSSKMKEMHKVPPEELKRRTSEIYQNLSDWLLNKTESEIERTYTEIGKRRSAQGVAFSHFFWAVISTKDHLWDFMQSERLADRELDLFGELELIRRIDQFFDRALYYAAQAYEREASRQAAATK